MVAFRDGEVVPTIESEIGTLRLRVLEALVGVLGADDCERAARVFHGVTGPRAHARLLAQVALDDEASLDATELHARLRAEVLRAFSRVLTLPDERRGQLVLGPDGHDYGALCGIAARLRDSLTPRWREFARLAPGAPRR
jgi:hypothetical protein